MPEPQLDIRLERAGLPRNGQPEHRPYTWNGRPPEHPDAPIGLCGGCGYLVTAKAHLFLCGGWRQEGGGPGWEWYRELADEAGGTGATA